MQSHQTPRFVLLLVSIIAELMIAPMFAGTEVGLGIAQVLTTVVMGAALWAGGAKPAAALVYFSFVTLTTVGYGDITPLWPGAGGLATGEAVVGQLYLAITIARLVGLHTSQRA